MRLKTQGGPKLHHKHCRQFIRMFCQKFFTKEISKQIKINLTFEKKKSIGCDEPYAEVEWIDNPRQPRSFRINIFYVTRPTLLYTIASLAHEMVHVKQYVKNELIDLVSTDYNVSIYKNKKYNLSKVNYHDQPWEIEAYGRTPGLIREYFKKTKLPRKLLRHPVDF